MHFSRGVCLCLLGWAVVAAWACSAQAQAADSKQPAAKAEPAKPPRTLDALDVPPGAIFVLLDDAKNALGLIKGVWLTPEKYQELLDQIETLKRQAKPQKPIVPSACKLTGQVEDDLVRLQAQFEIRTERPRTQVFLGCQKAWPKSAALDGQLPLLLSGEEGLVVQVEQAGTHRLTLDLELALLSKGTSGKERGFEIGLPRAAITTLEQFKLPGTAAEVRINNRSVPTKPLDARTSRVEGVLLGAADHLDLLWKGPAPAPPKGPPLLAAEGRIFVTLSETRVTTEVELNLQVLRGETRHWRILLPPNSVPQLIEPGFQDERVDSKELPRPNDPWLTIRLKEASAEPLRVVFRINQERQGTLVPVGPFSVQQAFQQRGTIGISAPPELRLRYHLRGDISQREPTEDLRRENAVAAFTYWNLPAPAGPGQALPAPLDLEIETVKGVVETRTEHALQLQNGGLQLATKIDATPIRAGTDHLEVRIPADYPFDREKGALPAELVQDVVIDPQKQTAQIKLAQKQFRPFSVTLPALIALPAGSQHVSLELPRPLHTLDRGCQLTLSVPAGQELVDREAAMDPFPPGTQKHTWSWERTPARVEIGWREYRPALPVEALVDVTMTETDACVRHRLQFQFPDAPPNHVRLRIPQSLAERVRVLQGGTLGTNGVVFLDRPEKKSSLTLDYSTPLEPAAPAPAPNADRAPAGTKIFSVPLVSPVEATRIETKARIWSDPGVFFKGQAGGAWQAQPLEAVPGKNSLPALVLRTGRLDSPLVLERSVPSFTPLAPVVVERALIQVVVADGGCHNYRARFLLSRMSARNLDVELPGLPASGLNLEVFLDGKKVTRMQMSEGGDDASGGTSLRLDLEPDLYQKPALLDLRYRIDPGRTKGNRFLQSTFYPPVLGGDVYLGQARWQVKMPAGWVLLSQDGGSRSEQQWQWRGFLLTPCSAVSDAGLERWLGTPDTLEEPSPEPTLDETSLVSWRAALEPFAILQVPQQAWLLACSFLFLVVGLGLSFLKLPRVPFWMVLCAFGLFAAYADMRWPSLVPALLYGCEPGAVVLLLVLAVQWLLHQRYRRQVVFLPGFDRGKPGSSVVRLANSARPHSEPSTIDSPKKENAAP